MEQCCQITPRQQKRRTAWLRILVIALLNPTLQHLDHFQSLKCSENRSARRLPPVARFQCLTNLFWISAAVHRRAFLTLHVVLSKAILWAHVAATRRARPRIPPSRQIWHAAPICPPSSLHSPCSDAIDYCSGKPDNPPPMSGVAPYSPNPTADLLSPTIAIS